MEENITIVKTDEGNVDGQTKCPKCGSTDISLNANNGHLRCHFCRHEFEFQKVKGLETNLNELKGQIIGTGAKDIIADTNNIKTFKCNSCGAEVVIDTAEAVGARCHWCRNTLTINEQIPNGSIPDVVLPFRMNKEMAQKEIEKFVGKRKFFAHPKFKEEFKTDNIMGVYFPYLLVDVNSHVFLRGEGEHLARTYSRGSGENRKIYYDADLYAIEREFDLMIEGITVESNSERRNTQGNTNNVINAIMPFDIENCVKWDANYLKGYTSERRDTNIDELRDLVGIQTKDIARFSANETLKEYDRGVAWTNEKVTVKGEQWKAAYLPVWLYSYQQVTGDKKVFHYVAVNARTKEIMGSVPIHMPKLLFLSVLVEIFGMIAMLIVDFDYSWLFLLIGFIYFFLMYSKYRNKDARHRHETETKKHMGEIRKIDSLIAKRTGLTNPKMLGANNLKVHGESISNQILDTIASQNTIANFIKSNINKGGE